LNGWKTGSPFKWKWTRVAYIKGKVPARGSIIFFDKTLQNPYGHVAIVQTADITSVTVSEQNAWSGTGNWVGTNAVTTRKYPYAKAPVWNVLGWYELP
jgi:surface antigen